MTRNLFLTPRGVLNRDGRRLCLLAAQPDSDRAKLADEYRRKGYDHFSINCVFHEADGRRAPVRKANQERWCDGYGGPPEMPAGDPAEPRRDSDVPPSEADTVVATGAVRGPDNGAVPDRAGRLRVYLFCGQFLAGIAEHPGDPAPRLAFADWLEAHGLGREAAGQRWAARHGKRPVAASGDFDVAYSGWYADGDRADDSAALPDCLYRVAGVPANSSPLRYECYFLQACGEVEWGADGEPIRP
jgi:uncharacterized protein (TIGR02996 family)